MSIHRTIPASLAVLTLLAACHGTQETPVDTEETLEETSQALPLAPPTPPLINPVHGDLSSLLAPYTGHPGAGAPTPGMIAAVVKGKHIVAIGAAGYAKIPEMIPMTEDMIFNIGSNTKSMTAVLLSMLIEENPNLTWDSTLEEALPWANEAGKDYFRPSYRKLITLEQLVAHRSGIACGYPQADGTTLDNTDFSHIEYGAGDAWKGKTRQQLLKEYLRGPEIAAGGEPTGILADCIDEVEVYGYHYENMNFFIAQAVIDHWSGMSFLDYAKTKLIEPYGLGTTFQHVQAFMLAQPSSITGTAPQQAYWNPYFSNSTHPFLDAGKYSWGHNEFGTPHSVLDPDVTPWGLGPGAGGFAFNMEDWARYAILHMRETGPAWVNVHEKTYLNSYNFGWSTKEKKTKWNGISYTAMCHTGALTGMNSHICVYPELDIAYLSFANGGDNPKVANSEVINWLIANVPYKADAGGCADSSSVKGVQRFWESDMYGCAGSVSYGDRATLCAAGHHVCSAQEFVDNNTYGTSNAEPPKHHYWTNDQLGYGGSASSCWAAAGGTSCGATTPMRVCAPSTFDPEGNKCNWTGCGFGSGNTTDRHFGGCATNTTAGTLCCKD